jgi:SsrA-binding protein
VAKDDGQQVISTNRKALFNYEVLERAEAGISLVGSEVKSIREAGLNFRDSYVDFRAGELWLVGCHIGPYSHGNIQNHNEGRDRKLLLHKREILKLGGKATERGLTIVPLRAYFKDGRVKVEIAVARGKDVRDKRRTVQDRDARRQIERELKSRR